MRTQQPWFRTHHFTGLLLGAVLLAGTADAKPDWKKTASKDGVTVFNRDVEGSDVKELLAVGTIDAEPWVVKNIIDDVANYKDFMPYTEKSTVVSRGEKSLISYQLINTPMVSKRDYVIEIKDKSKRGDDGKIIYLNKWKTKAGVGPVASKKVVRITQNTGYWELRQKGAGKTKASYYLFTDPGGSLPTFIINAANEKAVPDVFKAIRKQIKNPRYLKTKPAIENALSAPANTP